MPKGTRCYFLDMNPFLAGLIMEWAEEDEQSLKKLTHIGRIKMAWLLARHFSLKFFMRLLFSKKILGVSTSGDVEFILRGMKNTFKPIDRKLFLLEPLLGHRVMACWFQEIDR